MAIYKGLGAIQIRSATDLTYIHEDCKQELKFYSGLQNTDEQRLVLKCDTCNKVVGEWLTQAEQQRELEEWYRVKVFVDPSTFQPRKASPGEPRETTPGEFVAESLEVEAAKMPPSMKEQADALRNAAHYYREHGGKRKIRVWEVEGA